MFNASPVLCRMADMEAVLEQEITENKDGRDSHSCELNSVALNCFLNNVVSYLLPFFVLDIRFVDFFITCFLLKTKDSKSFSKSAVIHIYCIL